MSTEVFSEDFKAIRIAFAVQIVLLVVLLSVTLETDRLRYKLAHAYTALTYSAYSATKLEGATELAVRTADAQGAPNDLHVLVEPESHQNPPLLLEAAVSVLIAMDNLGLNPEGVALTLALSGFANEPVHGYVSIEREKPGRERRSNSSVYFGSDAKQAEYLELAELTRERCSVAPLGARMTLRTHPSVNATPGTAVPIQLTLGNRGVLLGNIGFKSTGLVLPAAAQVAPLEVVAARLPTAEISPPIRCREHFPLHLSTGYGAFSHIAATAQAGITRSDFAASIESLSQGRLRPFEGFSMALTSAREWIAIAALLVSICISILLRRLALAASSNGVTLSLFLLHPVSPKRISPIDGPHFRLVERLSRALFLCLVITAAPLAMLVASDALLLPASELLVEIIGAATGASGAARSNWRFLFPDTTSTAWLVSFALSVMIALHQLLTVFFPGSRRASQTPPGAA